MKQLAKCFRKSTGLYRALRYQACEKGAKKDDCQWSRANTRIKG